MVSPYPNDVKTETDKQIFAIEEAQFWLSRIDYNKVNINIEETKQQLNLEEEELKEEYISSHLSIAIEDYVVNNPEKIQKLFDTNSIDERVDILDNIKNNIMGRFGLYKPDKLEYDEILKRIENYVKNNSITNIDVEF